MVYMLINRRLKNIYYLCKMANTLINPTMSTAELKIDLISRIANTEEPRIIEELRKLLDFELDNETYKLNPQQLQRVSEAKAEYLAGNVVSEQQADEEIDEWISEK